MHHWDRHVEETGTHWLRKEGRDNSNIAINDEYERERDEVDALLTRCYVPQFIPVAKRREYMAAI